MNFVFENAKIYKRNVFINKLNYFEGAKQHLLEFPKW